METIKTINDWARKQFPKATDAGRLNKFLDEMNELGMIDAGYPAGFDLGELPDVFITLVQVMADYYGSAEDAQQAVDFKMAINRQRSWNINPDGTGQHVGEGDAEDGHHEAPGP